MAKTHQVFISYSSKDRASALAILGRLESDGFRCWIAPRDIAPGADWGEAIVNAIGASKIMVLLYTSSANVSQQVMREVERAVSKSVIIVPLRIEDTPLSKNLEYFISASHWLDAMEGALDQHLDTLSQTVQGFLSGELRPRLGKGAAAAKRRSWVSRLATLAVLILLVCVTSWFAVGFFLGGRTPRGTGQVAATAPVAPDGGLPPGEASQDNSKLFRQLQAAWVGTVYKFRAGVQAPTAVSTPTTAPAQRARPATVPTTKPADKAIFVSVPASRKIVACDRGASKSPPAPTTAATAAPTAQAIDDDGTGPYTVVIDQTHPNGRDAIRHTYLQIRSSKAPLTIMYYNLEATQQWAGEGFYLDSPSASRVEIPNGYRITYTFRINRGWPPDNDVNFLAFSYDWDNNDSPMSEYLWHGQFIDKAAP